MATHSSILSWEIPWTEEPGRLQSMGSQRVRHNLVTEHHHHHCRNGLKPKTHLDSFGRASGLIETNFYLKESKNESSCPYGTLLCPQKLEAPNTYSLDPSIANTRWAGWSGALPWRRTLDLGRK